MKKRKIKKENEISIGYKILLWLGLIFLFLITIAIVCAMFSLIFSSARIPGTIMSEIKNHIEKDLSGIDRLGIVMFAIILLGMLRFGFADIFSSLSENLQKEKESFSENKNKGDLGYVNYLLSLYFLVINKLITYSLILISLILFIAVNIFPKKIAQDVITIINVYLATFGSIYLAFKGLKNIDWFKWPKKWQAERGRKERRIQKK